MASSLHHLLPLILSLSTLFFLPLASADPAPTTPGVAAPDTAGPTEPALIEQTCKLTAHVEECMQALMAEPLAHKSDQRQLAAIALRLAYNNGTETAGYLSGLLDDTQLEPKAQHCLNGCMDDYGLALQQLDDALAALDVMVYDKQAYEHAISWIQTAMTHVKTCQDECKEGAEHKDVLSKKSGAISKLCSISISIIKEVEKTKEN